MTPKSPRAARAPALAAVVVSLAAAGAAFAQDGRTDSVDLQSTGTARVQGTIRSAAERESFVLELPQGARLTASVKRKGKSGLVPQLDLVDGTLTAVDGTVTRATRTGMRLSHAAVPASDTYRLRVFGSDHQHDGDYTLVFATKLASRFRETGTAAPSSFQNICRFGAPEGAEARIKVTKAKGSAFVPVLETLLGPDGFNADLPDAADSGWVTLGAAGDYYAGFHDGGAAGGDWICTVQLRKLPRIRKSKLDISAGKLTGSFTDDQAVFGRLVGGEETLVDPDDLGLGLDGASVLIPDGALSLPVVITMSVAPNFTPPGGDHATGPAVTFGPPGQTFSEAVVVTIPFNDAEYDDPAEEMTVYVVHAGGGAPEAVPKPYTFPAPGLVSFPRTSFSTFQTGRSGPRGLVGDFQVVALDFHQELDFGGRVTVENGVLSVHPKSGSWSLERGADSARWGPFLGSGGTPGVETAFDFATEGGTLSVPDDTRVVLDAAGELITLRRGASPDVLFMEPEPGSDGASVLLILRRAAGKPTFTNLAGRWNLFYAAGGATSDGPGQVNLFGEVTTGTAVIRTDGRVDLSLAIREVDAPYPDGAFTASRDPLKGAARIDIGEGNAVIRFPNDEGGIDEQGFGLTPCLGGDVLVATGVASDPFLLVLSRETKGLTRSAIAGPCTIFGLELDTRDGGGGATTGFRMTHSRTPATFTAAGRLMLGPATGYTLDHDGNGLPFGSTLLGESDEGPFTLSGTGVFRPLDSAGLVAPRASFLLAGSCEQGGPRVYFGIPGAVFQ